MILSIENHCSVPQQKKMAEYLKEVLQDKLDLSSVNALECKKLPSPEVLKGKILVKVHFSLVRRNVSILNKLNQIRKSSCDLSLLFARGKNCPPTLTRTLRRAKCLMRTLEMRKRRTKMMMMAIVHRQMIDR